MQDKKVIDKEPNLASTTNILTFPDETLMRIMFFSTPASIGKLAQASSFFRRLSKEEFLWKEKIKKELTAEPSLGYQETYQEFYLSAYIGIRNNMRHSPNFGDYLKELGEKKEEVMSEDSQGDSEVSESDNDARFLGSACALGLEIWAEALIRKGEIVSELHLRSAFGSKNNRLISLLLNHISAKALNFESYAGYEQKTTVFHLAAESDYFEESLKLLFADPSKISVLPELHKAAATGDIKKLNDLLSQGIPINMEDTRKCTALWWAIVCNQESCVKVLVSHKARLNNIGFGEHKSAGMVAVWRKRIEILRFLLETKNVNLSEETYVDDFHPIPLTLLHKAAEYGFTEGLKVLINHGIKVNNLRYPFSALHSAAESGNKESIAVLIKAGALVNQKGKWISNDEDYKDDTVTVSTPLCLAAHSGNVECVKLLLQSGADPQINEDEQWIHKKKTTIYFCHSPIDKLFNHLEGYSFKKHPIFMEMKRENFSSSLEGDFYSHHYLDCLTLLLKGGVNPNKQDKKHVFNTYLMRLLLAWKQIANTYNHRNPFYLTNFSIFIEKCFEIFIAYKIDVNLKNAAGETALHMATEIGNLHFVRCLVESGNANLNIKEKKGNTPLMLAATGGYFDIVQYLIRAGASLQEINDEGKTVLDCAKLKGYDDIISFIAGLENRGIRLTS